MTQERAEELEIAKQLAGSFEKSQPLVQLISEYLEEHQCPLATVAFAICVIKDMMHRQFENYAECEDLVGKTFLAMQSFGAFTPPDNLQ